MSLLQNIFGSSNSRWLRRHRRTVERINALEPDLLSLSDEELQGSAERFRERLQAGEKLDDLLPEVFARVRESARRHLNMRHFDCQLLGGIALHEGCIAEMRTGEGKTLVATLAASLNALAGSGVHLITVNDYLAERDSGWMRPVYEGVGLTVSVVLPSLDIEAKKAAYACDIAYATNSEIGFDYLRDNMALQPRAQLQNGHSFAIIDEVDSILIDEARTPLIISGADEDRTDLYKAMNIIVKQLKAGPERIDDPKNRFERMTQAEDESEEDEGDYVVVPKTRSVELTERGHERVERILTEQGVLSEDASLYDVRNIALLRCLQATLRAHAILQRDVDYIVRSGQVMLIDEHTGRTLEGRRMSEGTHQALECKERVKIQSESRTLASTTYQNFFRLYDKLSGMTGTAETEAVEFLEIYGLKVVVVPTNEPTRRRDQNDLVYPTAGAKMRAIIADIRDCRERGQPVLVGTTSVEASEVLSRELKNAGLKHAVLNAKRHREEAQIIAQAGKPGAITIATNMAGRGTDIVLGGNWQVAAEKLKKSKSAAGRLETLHRQWQADHQAVLDAGGLRVLGTERHESRRIDNQLRGRSGRQGDPGSSRFYLSMDDTLLRLFISERMKSLIQNTGRGKEGEEDLALESRMLTSNIERAQRRIEGQYFEQRKRLLEYDDIANEQRQVIYQQRDMIMHTKDLEQVIRDIRAEVLQRLIDDHIPPQSVHHQWDIEGLQRSVEQNAGVPMPISDWLNSEDELSEDDLRDRMDATLSQHFSDRRELLGAAAEQIVEIERQVLLRVIDLAWCDHLSSMDYLRQSIGLRAYGQRDPRQEYRREAFELFQTLLNRIRREAVHMLSMIHVQEIDPDELPEEAQRVVV
ncbi:MAG: preprotein translocase subunit SecA [Gammaproteobacteria bacterium AqS3]|nr:preprotein translocase subunit SecA [Gammaproteobacteria bacterium AqS3]